MDISIFLARVFGIYFVVMALGFLFRPKKIQAIAEQILNAVPVLILSGFIAFILGLLVVVGHNVWAWNWRVIITLLGWLMVIQGMLRIFLTEQVTAWGRRWVKGNGYRVMLIISLLLGLYLIYCGFVMG